MLTRGSQYQVAKYQSERPLPNESPTHETQQAAHHLHPAVATSMLDGQHSMQAASRVGTPIASSFDGVPMQSRGMPRPPSFAQTQTPLGQAGAVQGPRGSPLPTNTHPSSQLKQGESSAAVGASSGYQHHLACLQAESAFNTDGNGLPPHRNAQPVGPSHDMEHASIAAGREWLLYPPPDLCYVLRVQHDDICQTSAQLYYHAERLYKQLSADPAPAPDGYSNGHANHYDKAMERSMKKVQGKMQSRFYCTRAKVYCMELVQKAVIVHTNGIPKEVYKDVDKAKKLDTAIKCGERVERLINVVRDNKLVAEDVIAGYHLDEMAYGPFAYCGTKEANIKNAYQRKGGNEKGPSGSKRKASEVDEDLGNVEVVAHPTKKAKTGESSKERHLVVNDEALGSGKQPAKKRARKATKTSISGMPTPAPGFRSSDASTPSSPGQERLFHQVSGVIEPRPNLSTPQTFGEEDSICVAYGGSNGSANVTSLSTPQVFDDVNSPDDNFGMLYEVGGGVEAGASPYDFEMPQFDPHHLAPNAQHSNALPSASISGLSNDIAEGSSGVRQGQMRNEEHGLGAADRVGTGHVYEPTEMHSTSNALGAPAYESEPFGGSAEALPKHSGATPWDEEDIFLRQQPHVDWDRSYSSHLGEMFDPDLGLEAAD